VCKEFCHGILEFVGFSSVFEQTLASIAIAKLLKRERPGICTVSVGQRKFSNGGALADLTNALILSFPAKPIWNFQGFVRICLPARPSNRLIECEPIRDMDVVAIPDFRDYFMNSFLTRRHGDGQRTFLIGSCSRPLAGAGSAKKSLQILRTEWA
jgi:hypothetical protein